MPRGIMYVETWPASPEEAEEYHRWYNETHMQEILAIEGFKSARRFEPLGHDGPYIAIYEIDADDIDKVRAEMAEATRSGRNSRPVGVRMDPQPVVRYFGEIAECRP